MMADGPVIDYRGSKKKGMGNSAQDKREMDDLAEAYAKKREKEGSMAGKTFSLDGFLAGKM